MTIARPAAATAALASALGARADGDPTARRACDLAGVVPAFVARPADAAEVAATVAAAGAAGAALVPLGRGAHRSLGQAPARYDLALVTARLDRIRDYTPADMTVTVEAGTTVADLDALLAREGQWLPIEPPLPAATTVGGLLAADLASPLAGSQGRVRDFVIGIEVVTAAGIRARAGGRVVKNVAGYDLMKLVIGSLGTLAVLTEATFKVRPRPETERVLGFRVRDAAAALTLAAAIRAGAAGALAVVACGDRSASGARVLVRLGGVGAEVAAAAARVVALADDAETELDRAGGDPEGAGALAAVRDFPASVAGDLVVRLAALPSRLAALATEVAAAPELLAWQADGLRGTVHAALATPDTAATAAELTRLADRHHAHLVVERWPLGLAAPIAVWHPLPAALPLMRRMKAALDPDGVFASGRFVGGL